MLGEPQYEQRRSASAEQSGGKKKHLELLKLSDIRSTLGTGASIAVPGRYLYSNHVTSFQPGDT